MPALRLESAPMGPQPRVLNKAYTNDKLKPSPQNRFWEAVSPSETPFSLLIGNFLAKIAALSYKVITGPRIK